MRTYIMIIFAALSMYSTAKAQNTAKSVLGAKVDVQRFEYNSDSVRVNLEYNLDELEIAANQSVIFTPTIYKGDNSMTLPTVVVKRRGGARSYNRAMALGNRKSVEAYDKLYGTPYEIVEFFGGDKQNTVQYSFTTAYKTWMADSQLYVDCASFGCCKKEDNGMLIPDNNKLNINVPTFEVYEVNPQVQLVKPAKVAVKRRDIQYSSALIFRVNSTYIDPNLEGNRAEIESIDKMMQSVISDSDYTITKVNIIGFASPEGTLAGNMRLSEGRAKALEVLMKQKYRMIDPSLYSVRFGGENWDKLYEIVSQGDYSWKDEVLDIIKNVSIEDGRETKLMALNGGVPYRFLLKNVFPSTRLVVVDVEYNIDAYDLVRIGELIDTKPENLSLEEMYRLSETYEIEDNEFEKIFMTAAQIYPDDDIAMNNALVAGIRSGNMDSFKELADGIDRQTESAELANSLGAYYMLSGDYATAKVMLQRAIELGSSSAKTNMEMLNTKLENIQQIKEADILRTKIYGY